MTKTSRGREPPGFYRLYHLSSVETDIARANNFADAARRLKLNRPLIINEFERRTREEIIDAQDESRAVLIDSMPLLFDKLVLLLESNLDTMDAIERTARVSKEHGEHRIGADFNLEELMWEYQIFRQILFESLEKDGRLAPDVRNLILDFVQFATRAGTNEFVRLQQLKNMKPWRAIGLQHSAFSYGLSTLIIAVATIVQWLIYPAVGTAPYILYYPAVIIASIYANGPLAIVLSTILAEYFFVPPIFDFDLLEPHALTRIGVFVASGAVISILSQRMQTAHKKAIVESVRARSVADKRDALAEINSLSLSAKNRKQVFDAATSRIMRAMQAPYVKVLEHDPSANVFRPVAFISTNPTDVLPSAVPVDEKSLAGRALISKVPVIVRDFEESSAVNRPTLIPDPAIRSGIAVIIGGAERAFGALVVQCVEVRDYTDDEKKFMQDAALSLANAVERFRAEEELRKSQDQLVEINSGLLSVNRALAGDREELTRSNKDLSRFAGIAAHDLKSPLNTITQFIELIQHESTSELGPETREYFQFIVRAAERMRTLIDRLLNYARAGAKNAAFTAVAVNDVVKTAEDNLHAAIRDTGAKIKLGSLPVVYGDASDLAQVFQNLIGNALKFRSNAPPEVVVSAQESSPACYQVTVCDNGVGIPSTELSKIFEPFMRVETTDQPEGSGLGLAIVKKIIDNHGGRIWAESKPGEGTKFHFTLPKPPSNH